VLALGVGEEFSHFAVLFGVLAEMDEVGKKPRGAVRGGQRRFEIRVEGASKRLGAAFRE
jgi:hypothetical protein